MTSFDDNLTVSINLFIDENNKFLALIQISINNLFFNNLNRTLQDITTIEFDMLRNKGAFYNLNRTTSN